MFIGLDIGTSGTKAACVSESGEILGYHSVSYGFSDTADGHRELNAEEVWEAAVCCLRVAASGREVKTIAVSALGEAVVPVDREGHPLCGGITGTDVRGTRELEELIGQAGEEYLVSTTGQNLSVIYSVNKIRWLMKHEPRIYEKAWKILTFQDYIIYRLCKEAVIDRSMAARTLLMDAQTNDWSRELLELTGIDREKLSRIRPAGAAAGYLTEAAARLTGIQGKALVITGTHDHVCNAIGCGVLLPGDCSNTTGTSEGLTAVLEKESLGADSIRKYQISRQPFAVDGLYNTIAWNNTSGVMLRWFVTQMVREEPAAGLTEIYAKMNREMPSSPTKLLVLPHFSGAATPHMDPASRGTILGLTLDTSREEIYRGLMEGACYELDQILDCLVRAGMRPAKLTATGGALSPQLLQMKADILDRPVYTVKNPNTGVLGGGMLGAVAMGVYGSLRDAADNMVHQDRIYEPDSANARVYRERKALYREIYPAVKEIYGSLQAQSEAAVAE